MRQSYESQQNGTTFLPSEAEGEGAEPALSSESGSWYERESPFLSLHRGPGNEVAPPDPLAEHAPSFEGAPEEGETRRAPWDIFSEGEDPTLHAWTSDAHPEREAEGLTFYGEESAFAPVPAAEQED